MYENTNSGDTNQAMWMHWIFRSTVLIKEAQTKQAAKVSAKFQRKKIVSALSCTRRCEIHIRSIQPAREHRYGNWKDKTNSELK